MTPPPFVSVIIPNYNHADFLDERIQSVLSQTYQDFEIIILDDNSTDDSRDIIEKYRENPHVSHIVFNQQNSGSTFLQWCKGLQLARGEYIWIAESDDYCENIFLETCVKSIVAADVVMLHTVSKLVNQEGHPLNIVDISQHIPTGIYDGKEFIKKYLTIRNYIWNASAVIFKRIEALCINPVYTHFKSAGDHLFWINMAEQGRVSHISTPLNYFRQHSVKVTPAKYREGITHLETLQIVKYLKQQGLLEKHLEREVYKFYLCEINFYHYDTPQICKKVISEWRKSNYKLYFTLMPQIICREWFYMLFRRLELFVKQTKK